MLLLLPSLLRYLGVAALMAAVLSFGAYKSYNYGYNKAVAGYTVKALAAEKEARSAETKLRKQLDKALHESAIRESRIKNLSRELGTVSNSLRDAIEQLRRELPQASGDAAVNTADSALSVLGECQKEYGLLAEKADRHANDVTTLMDAWPKN